MKFFRIPRHRINWKTSSFLISTALITLTAVPAYIWHFGLDWFQVGLFLIFFISTGISITLGYHRLFSHRAFRAKWPVKLFTAIFGAAAFENSILDWVADHRRHHKHVDHDDDPYDVSKGFFHAHIGWLLFKMRPEPPLDNVADLLKDRMVMWQHRWCHAIGFTFGFGLPAAIGYVYGGPVAALGGFLIAGVARVVAVQHCTFCINSLCHTVGRRPYSSRCSARDSAVMAWVTFGEGYHNYHHEFQWDYRNGVKPWQFDPTKWTIWLLHKVGLAEDLRRVPQEKILLAEIQEAHRQLRARLSCTEGQLTEYTRKMLQTSHDALHDIVLKWNQRKEEYVKATERRIETSRELLLEMKTGVELAWKRLEQAAYSSTTLA
jgi:stearoyl-CoA desaturase (Delta-9 desaturase)